MGQRPGLSANALSACRSALSIWRLLWPALAPPLPVSTACPFDLSRAGLGGAAGLLLLAQPPMIGGRCAKGLKRPPPMKEQFFLLCIALRWIAFCKRCTCDLRGLGCCRSLSLFCHASPPVRPAHGRNATRLWWNGAEPLAGLWGLPVGAALLYRKAPAPRPASCRCRSATLSAWLSTDATIRPGAPAAQRGRA
jgi:hypothetical protein